MPEQDAFNSTGRETELLNDIPSGTMCGHSTDALGKTMSTPSQRGSLAKISVSQGGAGIEGARSGLWKDTARIIYEVGPDIVVLENSPMLTSRGLGQVLGDLAGMGLDARWGVFRASTIGAAHHRARLYLVAYPHGTELEGVDLPKPLGTYPKESRRRQFARAVDAALPADDYTAMSRNPDDVARGMDGLKTTGNGWVPAMAARAVKILAAPITIPGGRQCK